MNAITPMARDYETGELVPAQVFDIVSGKWVPNFRTYYRILVAFSGGKDSLDLIAELKRLGAPWDRIELWHHDVDGGGRTFMDWPITPAYCREVARALNLPIFFSWKEGGFEREMMREKARTAPNTFECEDGTRKTVGGIRGKLTSRLQFPQVSADLSVRWCSSYLKIDVMTAAINNQSRFLGQRTLVLTGERAQESSARAKYGVFEPHKSDPRSSPKWAGHADGRAPLRWVDTWRAVHHHTEQQVWDAIRWLGILPHPAYLIGWSRLSCMTCIFGSPNQWATIQAVFPARFEMIDAKEVSLGKTIAHAKGKGVSVRTTAAKGKPYAAALADPELCALSQSEHWDGRPVLIGSDAWVLPAGAFAENAGPC